MEHWYKCVGCGALLPRAYFRTHLPRWCGCPLGWFALNRRHDTVPGYSIGVRP